jgi:hypothetical protein
MPPIKGTSTPNKPPENPTWTLDEGEEMCRDINELQNNVRKTGPQSNKIKQMQKQNTEDTQYKRDTDLRGSPSVGYIH